jgi:putative ABC transport system permease protein
MTQSSAKAPEATDEDALMVEAFGVDYNFVEVLDIPLLQGRSFSREYGDENSLIITETAARKMQWEDAIGCQLEVDGKTGTVVGVAEDFLFGDIEFEMPAAILFLDRENLNYMLIKYRASASYRDLRTDLEAKWREVAPGIPFNCILLDDYFMDSFGLIKKIAGIFTYIGLIAVLFSCLGLLGLASYMTERRTKEMGIRKILGASFGNIIWTVIKEFIILVIIADVLGLAIIYVGWQSILQMGLLFIQDISANTYIFVIGITLITSVLAITSQTLKTAWANPIESLRYE